MESVKTVQPSMAPPGLFVEESGRYVMDARAVKADIIGSNSWIPTWTPEDPEHVACTLVIHGRRDWILHYQLPLDRGPLCETLVALIPHYAKFESNARRLDACTPAEPPSAPEQEELFG